MWPRFLLWRLKRFHTCKVFCWKPVLGIVFRHKGEKWANFILSSSGGLTRGGVWWGEGGGSLPPPPPPPLIPSLPVLFWLICGVFGIWTTFFNGDEPDCVLDWWTGGQVRKTQLHKLSGGAPLLYTAQAGQLHLFSNLPPTSLPIILCRDIMQP